MRQLFARILGLASFLGGPLYVADLLKPHLPMPYGFIAAFLPVALLVLGTLTLDDDARERTARTIVVIGLIGVGLLLLENGIAAWQLTQGRSQQNLALTLTGIGLGTLASLWYVRAAVRFFRATEPGAGSSPLELVPSETRPGPLPRHWLLLAISLAFCGSSVLVWQRDWQLAAMVVVFFGTASAVFASTIWRRLRDARGQGQPLRLEGGVRLRPSRTRAALLGGTVLAVGCAALWLGDEVPILLRLCGAVATGAGGLVLLGVISGKVPVGSLCFDERGMTIERRRFAVSVPWDAIRSVHPGEFADNPLLMFQLRSLEEIAVRPSNARHHFHKDVANTRSTFGADLALMVGLYGLSAVHLAKSLRRYVEHPPARQGLARRR